MIRTFKSLIALIACLFWVSACATGKNPYFERFPPQVAKSDGQLFSKAIEEQKQGRIEEAIKLWKRFLALYPDVYEAHNNLGMVYYANDQVGAALAEFEKGLSFEPSDRKIKDNLIIALNFQATILAEGKQYHDAIMRLNRVQELSEPEHREAVGREIERLEDKIFAQVKRSGSREDYEAFLSRYPNSPGNSDEARNRIAKFEAEIHPPKEDPILAMLKDKAGVETTPEVAEAVPPVVESLPEESVETHEAAVSEAIPFVEPESGTTPQPETMVTPVAPPEPVVETKPALPVKQVQIITRALPLNVRAEPSVKAEVLFKAPKGAQFPWVKENKDWFQIEYARGKTGWVYKKFCRLVE